MKNLTIVTIDCDSDLIKVGEENNPEIETTIVHPYKWIKFYQYLFDNISKGNEHISLYVRLDVQDEGVTRTIGEW